MGSEFFVDFVPAVCEFFSGPASKAGRTKPTGRPCRTRVFRKVASRLRETDIFACCENSGIAQEAEYCNSSRQIRHFLKSALGALATHFSKKSPNRPWPPQPEVRLANLASEPPWSGGWTGRRQCFSKHGLPPTRKIVSRKCLSKTLVSSTRNGRL